MILLALFGQLLSVFTLFSVFPPTSTIANPGPNVTPVVECPDDTDEIRTPQTYQEITGLLDNNSTNFQAGLSPCWLDQINPQSGDHYYQSCSFRVSEADFYTFDLYPNAGSSGADFMGALFQDSAQLLAGFDPLIPCQNMISQPLKQ